MGKETIDVFYSQVIASATQRPPVLLIDSVVYAHVRQAPGLFFVATLPDGHFATASLASPTFVLELLVRAAGVLRDFCGALAEESLRRNVVLAHELLDELFDYGYPQVTCTDSLRPLVHTPATLSPHAAASLASAEHPQAGAATAGSSAPSSPAAAVELVERKVGQVLERLGGTGPATTSVQNAQRSAVDASATTPAGTSRPREEVFVDLIERLTAVFAPGGGSLARCDVVGTLRVRNFLSAAAAAAPEAVVALSDFGSSARSDVFAECNFSRATNMADFERDRVLRVAMAPGETTAFNYRTAGTDLQLPFRVYPVVEETNPTKIVVAVRVQADFPSERQATSVSVRVAVPRGAVSVFCEASAGTAEYRREESAVVCMLSSVQGGVEFAVRASINLEKPSPAARKEIGPVELAFELAQWTATRVLIRSVQIEDRGGRLVKCFRWTRTLTTSNTYIRRL